ncbi:MAG TPA: VOC family protein, partial [Thermoanaerobaculia bacterium]|nr:VOC family protein [Thermoanaerobaculia bacterium]
RPMTATEETAAPAGGYGIPPEGPRLPAATAVGSVHLQVADLDRTLGWYGEVLGFAAHREGPAAALGVPGGGRPLVHLRARPGARPAPRSGRFGLYHFAILLPDRADLGRFVRHLGRLGHDAGMADHAVSEAIYLRDPDGLGIEVYVDRPRDAWRTRGRELVMTTEPLDADDLVAAGGEAPWSGLPAGTAIGHVHLHVGDLARADAFYRSALGLDKTVWSYPGALFFSAGGYHHHLGTNTWSPGPAPAEDEARLLSWELTVPEGGADRAADRLRAAGHAVEPLPGGGWRAGDPWGTPLHLVPPAPPRE